MSTATFSYSPLPADSGQDTGMKKRQSSRYQLILSLSLLCNAVLLLHWALFARRQPLSFPEAAPAQHMIEYKTIKFHRGAEDDVPLFERPPSVEGDQAWGELYAYAASRVTKSEVMKMTNKTWPILHDEGNYVIALDIFHQLHCLDMIRQQLELSRGGNYTRLSMRHVRHCVGAIRQALMCYADTTPVVWQWSTELMEAEQRDDLLHTCRDFDKIQGWAKERSMPMGLLPDLTTYQEV